MCQGGLFRCCLVKVKLSMKKVYPFIGVVLLLSCTASPIVKQNVYRSLKPLNDFENVVAFTQIDSSTLFEGIEVGDIYVKESGLLNDCTLDKVLDIAKSRARALGANAIMVYEYKSPSVFGSACYQIKAKALRLEDISEYESEIIWHRDRKLKIRDFKGATDNRPGIAATNSTFRYNGKSNIGINKPITLKVETVFDTRLSYFKADEDSLFVLSHEQLHFDISEMYARKFAKRVRDEIRINADLENKLNKIYSELIIELQIEQDRYDTDVYSDSTKQSIWNKNIKERLDELSEFEQKKVTIQYKNKK